MGRIVPSSSLERSSLVFSPAGFGSLRSHDRELVCRCVILRSCCESLAFANGVHDFNASNRAPRCPQRFEASHRPHRALHGAIILLGDIVEILACRMAIPVLWIRLYC